LINDKDLRLAVERLGLKRSLQALYKEIPEDSKNKWWGKFKILQLNGVMNIFMMYGMQHEIPMAKELITEMALQVVRNHFGYDEPICYKTAKEKNERRKK